jgi:hypothetical protein
VGLKGFTGKGVTSAQKTSQLSKTTPTPPRGNPATGSNSFVVAGGVRADAFWQLLGEKNALPGQPAHQCPQRLFLWGSRATVRFRACPSFLLGSLCRGLQYKKPNKKPPIFHGLFIALSVAWFFKGTSVVAIPQN